jgi:hypothetical protein
MRISYYKLLLKKYAIRNTQRIQDFDCFFVLLCFSGKFQ